MRVISNPASVPKSTLLTGLLWGDSGLKRLFKPMIRILLPKKDTRGRIAIMLDQWNRKTPPPTQEDWWSTLPAEIFTDFETEIRKAEAATGMDLSDWIFDWRIKTNEEDIQ